MAEEQLHLPVRPENGKPVVAFMRRNSTGSYVPPASGKEKILPHYMRASVGSCHDHCKFGKKHSTEEKVRQVFYKRIVAKPPNEQNASVSLDLTPRKGTPAVVKSEKASASRIHRHGASDIMIGKITTKSHLIRITRRDEVVMEKKVFLSGPRSYASPKAEEISLSGEHTVLSKLKTVAEKKTLRASEPSSEKRAVNSKPLSRKTSSASSRATLSLKQSFSRAARKLKSWKPVSSLKNQNNTSMNEKQPDIKETKKDEPKEKTLHVIKVEDENQPFEPEKIEDSALECSPRLESMGETCAIKMEDKVLESNRRETGSTESVTRLSVAEESPSLRTCETLPFSSDADGEITESVSEDDEAVSVGESCPLKGRGKVVCIQSEYNGVRILKFRRARTLEANLNDEGCGREKVVLKHLQDDLQGKKNTRGLFNNVIEQTASKLVKSRKSKVKALVGAFETVISLQDRKFSDHHKPAIEGS